MSGLYADDVVETLRRGAASCLGDWGLPPETEVRLLTVSENATFRADPPGSAAPVILRVHRPGYHTRAEIEAELAWIDALAAEDVLRLAEPLATRAGARLARFEAGGETRFVAAFAFMPGEEPAQDERLVAGFRDLGAISARLHGHARRWRAPDGFVRKTWDWETTVGPRPHWGDWRAGLGLTAEGRAVLERTAEALRERLAAYGTGEDRFGLIHADLRLANLLVDEADGIGVIDFDDCGFGWFMYDFAAAVSFIEHDPVVPDLMAAWVEGYRGVAALAPEHEAVLPTMVMLRRLLLTAWLASHAETPTAAEFGTGYTDGTVTLAEAFLAGRLLGERASA